MLDLTGTLWQREFALEKTNILFLRMIDREEFHASQHKQWSVIVVREDGTQKHCPMIVVADDLKECHWTRII